MYPAWSRIGGDPVSTPNLETLAAIMQTVATTVDEMREEQRKMREDLSLIRIIEADHAHTSKALGRAFESIDEIKGDIKRIDNEIPERLADRLLAIEAHQPTQKLVSSVVIKALVGITFVVGAFIWGRAIERQAPQYPVPTVPHQSSPR